MSKSERFSDIETGDLFKAAERLDASLNLDLAVRKALSAAIRNCGKSRPQIAEDMSRLMGQGISVAILDAFTAESKPAHRFPAAWLAAFCVVTRDTRVLATIVEHAGGKLVTSEEAMLIELARNYLAKKEATEKLESLEGRLRRGE